MKLKRLDPSSPEVTDRIVEMIRKMTPEEAYAILTYKTPGIEETDMTRRFPIVRVLLNGNSDENFATPVS